SGGSWAVRQSWHPRGPFSHAGVGGCPFFESRPYGPTPTTVGASDLAASVDRIRRSARSLQPVRAQASLRQRTLTTPRDTVTRMKEPLPYLTEDEIARRVTELAAEIDADYSDSESLVLVGVLTGAFIFLADLARKLPSPRRIECLAVSSYGARESETADSVRLLMDLRHDIRGEDVILVEDIVDTGATLAYLQRLLAARGPASLRTCSL